MLELASLSEVVVAARKLGHEPRLHPNGFITLDLDERHKMHVWSDKPLRCRPEDQRAHSHTFGFTSRVLCGRVTDEQMRGVRTEGGPYVRWLVPCKKGRCHKIERDTMTGSGGRFVLETVKKTVIPAGEQYTVPEHYLHVSKPEGFTATLMHIDSFGEGNAEVYLAPGLDPVFDRTFHSDVERNWAWRQIELVLMLTSS